MAAELLPKQQSPRANVIITPHAAEMARMMETPVQQVESDRLRLAGEAAQRFHCTVALKGAETLICAPDGEAYLNQRGDVGLATAGSGDVLAGILTGLCARGAEPLQGAVWAVAIHAHAGERLAKSRTDRVSRA